ncbi:COG4223 family protein, partial [Bradyrhizobium sp.]|uniref:COG4223 family protein n=1 Tax=Bradyrhizobium sp. TaxID=376 RepID=UPI003C70F4A7
MVDDRPDETGASPDQDRPKRAPPTIDLEPSEITSETRNAAGDAAPGPAPKTPSAMPDPAPVAAPISPWIIAPVSGAAAAALVIAVGWMLGWPAVQPASSPQLNAAVIDDLTARIAGLESRTGKPAADPAAAARVDGLEKSLAALRGELAATRAQSEKPGAAPPDLSTISGVAAIESAVRAQVAGISEQLGKIADGKAAAAKPADDVPLRRVVAASLLDVSVRHGDPYAAALAAAKSLAENAEALKPLDGFAASGVPSANALCRELVELAPKLAPPAPENSTTGSGFVDRLQAGAAKLVRIQRTDATAGDRGSVVARVMAAALR